MSGDRRTGQRAEPSNRPDALQELTLRLHEQAAENAKLDAELRYLLEELAVRKEYLADLECQLESARSRDGQHLEVIAEFAAYRQRFSHRTCAFSWGARGYEAERSSWA